VIARAAEAFEVHLEGKQTGLYHLSWV